MDPFFLAPCSERTRIRMKSVGWALVARSRSSQITRTAQIWFDAACRWCWQDFSYDVTGSLNHQRLSCGTEAGDRMPLSFPLEPREDRANS